MRDVVFVVLHEMAEQSRELPSGVVGLSASTVDKGEFRANILFALAFGR